MCREIKNPNTSPSSTSALRRFAASGAFPQPRRSQSFSELSPRLASPSDPPRMEQVRGSEMAPPPPTLVEQQRNGEPFRVAAISDGFDNGGAASCPDVNEYWYQLKTVGSQTLAALLQSEASDGRPVRVLAYDPHLSWVRRVAKEAGVATAAFLSQSCSVDVVYGEVWAGRLQLPMTDRRELFARGLLGVDLGPDDVPPFAARPDWCPVFLEAGLGQFEGLEDTDDVLVNSFHDIEPKEADYMALTWRTKTVGPTLPSFYLDDDRFPLNKTYGFNMFSSSVSCMAWLDNQLPCSVVLVSYGTVSYYDETQLEELGNGLCNSGKPFLWVVRSNEEHKLSDELRDKC